MDRVYQRDAVLAAYSITKDEQLKLILEQEEGDVKVCEAMRELFEDATNKGITKGIGIGRAEGRAEEKIETTISYLRSIMVNLNVDVERAMDILSIDEKDRERGGCGQILGPTMTGRKKNVVYGGREKESTSIV